MKKYFNSLKNALPIYYFIVLSTTLFVIFFSFYAYFINSIRTESEKNMKNMLDSVSNNIYQEIEKMSTVSLNALYSKSIIPSIQKNVILGETDYLDYTKAQEIYNSISAIIGPQQTVTQVNIYDTNGLSVGSGFYNYQNKVLLTEKPWYNDVLKKNGDKFLSVPESLSNIFKVKPHLKDHKFLSLIRLYFNSAHDVEGALEIIQDCDVLFSFVNEMSKKNEFIEVFIINDKNEIVYPYKTIEPQNAMYYKSKALENNLAFDSILNLKNFNNEKVSFVYKNISNANWDIFIVQSDNVINSTLLEPTILFVFLLFIILLITLYIIIIISKKILFPINELKFAIENLNLDNVLSDIEITTVLPKSQFVELQSLLSSFNNMYDTLSKSSKELIKSKEEEIKAKTVATQSLMKPHFLFNNLANISVMAEENMNEEIVILTKNLCDFLRYTTTNTLNNESIKNEFIYSEKYLLCMKVRYGDRFTFVFTPCKDIVDILIPKLILQPIIENSLKYAFTKKPPWYIHIESYTKNDKWFIEVRDNGCGINNECLEKVLKNLGQIEKSKDVTKLKIGGMGLQSVYLRLVLLYDKDAYLDIKNNDNNGTTITIGGRLF